jgi:hypothetical protein
MTTFVEGNPMTTTRLVIDRITIDCAGASIAIVPVRDEWSGHEQLCLEIVTADPAGAVSAHDEEGLMPYCPEPDHPYGRHDGEPRRRRRTIAATVIAGVGLLAIAGGAGAHSGSRGSTTATSAAVAAAAAGPNGPASTSTIGSTVASQADLAARCDQMIEVASAALGIDGDDLRRSLVANHEGQPLNDAIRQELSDARAVLVSRSGRTDATSPEASTSVDALDVAIAAAAATPCSAGAVQADQTVPSTGPR